MHCSCMLDGTSHQPTKQDNGKSAALAQVPGVCPCTCANTASPTKILLGRVVAAHILHATALHAVALDCQSVQTLLGLSDLLC